MNLNESTGEMSRMEITFLALVKRYMHPDTPPVEVFLDRVIKGRPRTWRDPSKELFDDQGCPYDPPQYINDNYDDEIIKGGPNPNYHAQVSALRIAKENTLAEIRQTLSALLNSPKLCYAFLVTVLRENKEWLLSLESERERIAELVARARAVIGKDIKNKFFGLLAMAQGVNDDTHKQNLVYALEELSSTIILLNPEERFADCSFEQVLFVEMLSQSQQIKSVSQLLLPSKQKIIDELKSIIVEVSCDSGGTTEELRAAERLLQLVSLKDIVRLAMWRTKFFAQTSSWPELKKLVAKEKKLANMPPPPNPSIIVYGIRDRLHWVPGALFFLLLFGWALNGCVSCFR